MKRTFKIEKLPLDVLINLLIELYEKGIDYVDLFSNNDDPHQDKLIILTKDEYINPEFMKDGIRPNIKDNSEDYKEYVDDEDDNKSPKNPPTIEIKKLTDDDIDKLS
jgi:hypothetical protein